MDRVAVLRRWRSLRGWVVAAVLVVATAWWIIHGLGHATNAKVVALDARTGKVLWKVHTDGLSVGRPVVAGRRVVLMVANATSNGCFADQDVIALDVATGRSEPPPRSVYPPDARADPEAPHEVSLGSGAVVRSWPDDRVIRSGGPPVISRVGAADAQGHVRWTRHFPRPPWFIVVGNVVLVSIQGKEAPGCEPPGD